MGRKRVSVEFVAEKLGAKLHQVPDAVFLPAAPSRSTWDRLYDWLVEQGYGPHSLLHSNTYAGDALMKRLLAAEGERIRKKEGFRGDRLKAAVSFSNTNAGPMETHAWSKLVGDALFVLPDERLKPPGSA